MCDHNKQIIKFTWLNRVIHQVAYGSIMIYQYNL